MDILTTVRRLIGRRHKITRAEMRDLLEALAGEGLCLGNDCMMSTWTWQPAADGMGLEADTVSPDAARIWANACRDITVISVMASGAIPHGQVRYDEPGRMAPLQHCQLMFVAEELGDHEYDQIGQMRRKAERVLIVSGAELPDPAAPALLPETSLAVRLRKLMRVDGVWDRILDDGILERRDPNDGQSNDPSDKSRYQYRVGADGYLQRRHLPPQHVGDAWRDIGIPEWETDYQDPHDMDTVLYRYWSEQVE